MRLDPYPRLPDGKEPFLRKLTDLFRSIAQNAALTSETNEYQACQSVRFFTLTDGATVTTDASESNHFRLTLGGNRTLANPVNLTDGVILNWWVKQDGTGSRTLAYGNKFKWPAGTTPTITAAAGSLDLIVGQYNQTLDIIACAITQDIR